MRTMSFAAKDRRRSTGWKLTAWMLPCLLFTAAYAQYPVRPSKDKAKPEPKLRSIAVLEWTGEAGKPRARPIIPIAGYDGGRYQDGGPYLAQPAPLAGLDGTEYDM